MHEVWERVYLSKFHHNITMQEKRLVNIETCGHPNGTKYKLWMEPKLVSLYDEYLYAKMNKKFYCSCNIKHLFFFMLKDRVWLWNF